MLTEEVDMEAAKRETREMAMRQAAEEAVERSARFLVAKGTHEATVNSYEKLPDEKRWPSEVAANAPVYLVDFDVYDTAPGTGKKVQGVRVWALKEPVQGNYGKEVGQQLYNSLVVLADSFDSIIPEEQLVTALDWARTNRVKITVGTTEPKDPEKAKAFHEAGKKIYNKVTRIQKA